MTIGTDLNKRATELTVLEYALIHSSWEPTENEIESQGKRDRNSNPYNEPNKPDIRSRNEIIRDLKIQYLSTLLK